MNLNRDILRLAVPSILANITVPLVGMVDIAVAGHLGTAGGASAAALIGGISIGTMLFDMLYWNFGFLRAGTGGLTAQAFGKYNAGHDEAASEIALTLKRALGIAIASGLALVALQWVVVKVAFLLVDCSPEVQTLATQYFYIRIWAAPATLSLFAFKGWFIGMQDTVRPMICDLLVNAINILLSICLAFGFARLPALGFAGVAYGTLIAQWTGFLYALLAVRHRYGAFFIREHGYGHKNAPKRSPSDAPAHGGEQKWAETCPTECYSTAEGTKTVQNAPDGVLESRDGVNNGLECDRRETVVSRGEQKWAETSPTEYYRTATAAKTPQNAPDGVLESCDGVNNDSKCDRRETVVSRGDNNDSDDQREAKTDRGWRAFFVLNRDLFLRSVCMIAVYIGFTVIAARYGDMMLAVSTILMKLLMIFSYFTDGFAYAGEALTGRFIGEKSREGVLSTIRGTFLWSLGVTGLFFLVYGIGGVPLLRLMTSDASVVESARAFLPWLLLMPVIGCPAFTWDGIFIGATQSKDLRNSTVWCVVGFFAVWFIGLGLIKAVHGSVPETLAVHLLMAAYFTHLFVRALYLTLRWRKAVLSA